MLTSNSLEEKKGVCPTTSCDVRARRKSTCIGLCCNLKQMICSGETRRAAICEAESINETTQGSILYHCCVPFFTNSSHLSVFQLSSSSLLSTTSAYREICLNWTFLTFGKVLLAVDRAI